MSEKSLRDEVAEKEIIIKKYPNNVIEGRKLGTDLADSIISLISERIKNVENPHRDIYEFERQRRTGFESCRQATIKEIEK